ncbi:hypothetical protein Taro_033837 [Colocasia esculenta]|uniref:Uncharacterized protein n=1 Tax=Colocasia esculenta TaxID=4460 RepID=A0A843WDP3_COLES|nr:hypothetical protein [Colocasia esculenta]
MERQLDLPSVAARLRGRPVLACPSQFLVSRTSSRDSCLAVSTLACTPVLVCRLIITVVFRSRQTKFEMADRRDWGGGGDDLEESTQRMIERIWESLTDIRARMDQQAPIPPVAVPPGDGETVHVAPVPPRVEVRARRTFLDRRPVQSCVIAVQGQYLQLCSSSSSSAV